MTFERTRGQSRPFLSPALPPLAFHKSRGVLARREALTRLWASAADMAPLTASASSWLTARRIYLLGSPERLTSCAEPAVHGGNRRGLRHVSALGLTDQPW